MRTPMKMVPLFFALAFMMLLTSCSSAVVQPTEYNSTHLPVESNAPITPSPKPIITAVVSLPAETLETNSPKPDNELEVTASPEPEEESDDNSYTEDFDASELAKAGITQDEYQKIYILLYSALAMHGGEMGPPFYFKDAKKLTPTELFYFLIESLMFITENEGYTNIGNCEYQIGKSDIENIIKSAFGIDYHSGFTGDSDSLLTYSNGVYTYSGVQGSEIDPYVYSIKRIAPDKLQLQMDVAFDGDEEISFDGKAQAILQEGPGGFFGYHLVSLTEMKESKTSFSEVSASSTKPSDGKKSYKPANILDKNEDTVWMPDHGKNQWIEIKAASPQIVTGMIINYDPDDYTDWQPTLKVEFSDGSSMDLDFTNTYYISFGKEIKTTYIKFIIEGKGNEANIADIIPY